MEEIVQSEARRVYVAPRLDMIEPLAPNNLLVSLSAEGGFDDWEFDENDPNTEL